MHNPKSYKGRRVARRRKRSLQTVCGVALMVLGAALIMGAYLYVPPVIGDKPPPTSPVDAISWTINNTVKYAEGSIKETHAKPPVKYERPFFVGNSLVEGMRLNSDDGYDFCCKVGISLKELNNKLKKPESYDCAIIEMGSNELGSYSEDDFCSEYKALIQTLDCPCYCLSIPPVNEQKSKYASRISNKNVKRYNDYIQQVCEDTGAVYIDCSPFFGEQLNRAWTHDGLHLGSEQYAEWYAWVLEQVPISRTEEM